MTFFVYALVKSGEFRPFYIGATNNLTARKHKHHERWRDERFDLLVMAQFEDDWQEAGRVERETIDFYTSRNVPLRNYPHASHYHPMAQRAIRLKYAR